MDYIKIHNDSWDDLGIVWGVMEYKTRSDSSAIDLVLENTHTKEVVQRVVASHQIEWLEAKDW